jgi:hypothetical protein
MSAQRKHDLVDFYLGFAFGLFGVAAFLVGSWSHGYLEWLIP